MCESELGLIAQPVSPGLLCPVEPRDVSGSTSGGTRGQEHTIGSSFAKVSFVRATYPPQERSVAGGEVADGTSQVARDGEEVKVDLHSKTA